MKKGHKDQSTLLHLLHTLMLLQSNSVYQISVFYQTSKTGEEIV